MSLQSGDSAPWATIRLQGVGLAAAGFAAEQHVPLGQVDVDVLAVLVDAQVDRAEHGQREHRHGGGVMVVMTVTSLRRRGRGGQAPDVVRGTAVPAAGGDGALGRGGQVELVAPGPVGPVAGR